MMNKLITAIQTAAGIYIYGLAGKSDIGYINCTSLIVRLVIAVAAIFVLQTIKKSACMGKYRRTSRTTDYQIKPKTI